MKQNGVVCLLGPALLFFIFPFECLISGPKVTGTFEKRAPGQVKRAPCRDVVAKSKTTLYFLQQLFGT